MQRYIGLPKVVGYSIVGTVVGLAGFEGGVWPLQGISLFLLELGVAIVLFEAGGRLPLRWFRHNPMVLVQSLLESRLTYFGVFWALHWLGVRPTGGQPDRADGDRRLAGRAEPRRDGHARLGPGDRARDDARPRSTPSMRWRSATRRPG